MGSTGIGGGLMEILGALLAIALIALLLNKSQAASQLVTSSAGAFNSLLQTVTMQSGGAFGGGLQMSF